MLQKDDLKKKRNIFSETKNMVREQNKFNKDYFELKKLEMNRVIVVGNKGTGKTSWINLVVNEEFSDIQVQYETFATFETDLGSKSFYLIDHDGYCSDDLEYDGIIIFADDTVQSVIDLNSFVENFCGKEDIRVVICYNKCDIGNKQWKFAHIRKQLDEFKNKNYSIMSLSGKSRYNLYKPIMSILNVSEIKSRDLLPSKYEN